MPICGSIKTDRCRAIDRRIYLDRAAEPVIEALEAECLLLSSNGFRFSADIHRRHSSPTFIADIHRTSGSALEIGARM